MSAAGMRRRQAAIGITFALMVLLFASLRQLDGDRPAQTAAALVYVVAVLIVTLRANRPRA